VIRSGIYDGDRNELVKQNASHLVVNFMSALGQQPSYYNRSFERLLYEVNQLLKDVSAVT
jgi:hypothetical protein